ncbi:MAG: DUF4249 domain-containing protein [Tannerella sp.]|jgi:hypothetical protein|nr:DUF4249 domain-containing protein [Tannerella sp.]
MKTKQYLLFAVLALIFFSCYKDISLESYRPEPELVMNGVVTTDTSVMVSISRTKFFTDTNPYEVVQDADVYLFVNGDLREQMRWTTNDSFYGGGVYMSDYQPETGDKIKVRATTKYGEVWAEETVPKKPAIEAIDVSYRLIYDHKSLGTLEDGTFGEIPTMEITYRITFTDAADIADFYFVRIDNPNPGQIEVAGNFDYSSDPVFQEQVSVVDGLFGGNEIGGQGGRAFTDKLIDGQRYALIVRESQSSVAYDFEPGLARRIRLYAITESYYNYLTSMQTAVDAADMASLSTFGFAEPVRIYTNIQGGVGILAVSRYDSKILDLHDVFRE